MEYSVVFSPELNATIKLPASKSISNRVLIINALAQNGEKPDNLADCDDTHVMVKALSDDKEVVDIMAAGTAMRFLTAYYSIRPGKKIITGSPRMQQRPIGLLVDALRKLGADITYTQKEGFPPLEINGKPLAGGKITLEGDISSQYISALLMVGPALADGLTLNLSGEIISRPYIDLTVQIMKRFGADVDWHGNNRLVVKPQPYKPVPFRVESDWSAASYWYELAALSDHAEVQLLGLTPDSLQGDRRGAELFRKLGVTTTFNDKGVVITKSKRGIDRMEENLLDIPDLAQTFVVTCCMLDIPFRFSGLRTLKIKETDRIAALITELSKLGYTLTEEEGDILSWDGNKHKPLNSPVLKTYDDHRMGMALAPAAIKYPDLWIDNPGVVTKSYPGFWNDLTKAGAFLIKDNMK